MCEPTTIAAISLAATLGGGLMQANAANQQGKYAQQTALNNAKMAEYAALDTQRRGEQEAADIQRRGASLKSSQRVSLASKGLDLSYGTAADLQDQTDFFTQSDVATARTNTNKEVWSARAQGQNYVNEGNAARANGKAAAVGSLLSTAGAVAGKWYQ